MTFKQNQFNMDFKTVVKKGNSNKNIKKKYPLSTSWKFYDHQKSGSDDYDKSTRYIGSFDDVITFWQYFNNIPKPSQLFYQVNIGKPYYQLKKEDKREISSISLFRNDIKPKWEDPINAKGGEINLKKFYKKELSPIKYLDLLWESLVLSCIGNNLEYSDEITGVRVVDSSIENKPLYRIEMWFSNLDHVQEMENNFRKILDLEPNDKIFMKKHE